MPGFKEALVPCPVQVHTWDHFPRSAPPCSSSEPLTLALTQAVSSQINTLEMDISQFLPAPSRKVTPGPGLICSSTFKGVCINKDWFAKVCPFVRVCRALAWPGVRTLGPPSV